MTSNSREYSNPAYQVPFALNCVATGAASSVAGRFNMFTKAIAKSVQVTVVTAGTTAGNNVIVSKVINGTSTNITTAPTIGTNAAGYTANVSLGDAELNQGDSIVVTKGADATAVMNVAVEMRLSPGGSYTLDDNPTPAGS